MKYDAYDLRDAYDPFLEWELNQIEILQQMRNAAERFVNLASFQGATADNAKAYVEEVLMNTIDSAVMALMEFEIRLMAMIQDLASRGDPSPDAILEDSVIDAAIGKVEDFMKPVANYQRSIDGIVSSVSDLIFLHAPDFSTYSTSLKRAKENAEDTLQHLQDFDRRHQGDMDNVNKLLSAVISAISYMSKTGKISRYVAGSALKESWFEEMRLGQLQAYYYSSHADPNFLDTVYLDIAVQTGLTTLDAFMPKDMDPKLLMQILKGGIDLSKASQQVRNLYEAIQIYKKGFRIIATVDSKTGETILKVVSAAGRTLSPSKQIELLNSLDIPKGMSPSDARSLAHGLLSGKGIVSLSDDAAKLTKVLGIGKDALELLKGTAKAGDDSASFIRNFAGNIKGTDAAGWVFYGVSIVADATDSAYNERTQKFSGFNGAEFAGKATSSTVQFLVPIAIGTAADPGFGTVVGVVVAVAGFAKWGEPKRSFYERIISDPIEGAVHDTKNFLSKLFW